MSSSGDELPGDETPLRSSNGLDEILIFGSPETRRRFLKQVAGTSAAIAVGPRLGLFAQKISETAGAAAPASTAKLALRLKINGKAVAGEVDTRTTFPDYVGVDLQLAGAEQGCARGQC